eukprot:7201895-Prymnesium_polylepis.1
MRRVQRATGALAVQRAARRDNCAPCCATAAPSGGHPKRRPTPSGGHRGERRCGRLARAHRVGVALEQREHLRVLHADHLDDPVLLPHREELALWAELDAAHRVLAAHDQLVKLARRELETRSRRSRPARAGEGRAGGALGGPCRWEAVAQEQGAVPSGALSHLGMDGQRVDGSLVVLDSARLGVEVAGVEDLDERVRAARDDAPAQGEPGRSQGSRGRTVTLPPAAGAGVRRLTCRPVSSAAPNDPPCAQSWRARPSRGAQLAPPWQRNTKSGVAGRARWHASQVWGTCGRWPMISPEAVSGRYARPA